MTKKVCVWKSTIMMVFLDSFCDTSCGHRFYFSEVKPDGNHPNCPYCGNKIKVVQNDKNT